MEPKDVRKYFGKTVRKCTTCEKEFLYIKIQLGDSSVLECPRCDTTETVPKGLENLP
jgi:hypothetical protein